MCVIINEATWLLACDAPVLFTCHSHRRPSPILLAIGVPSEVALNALRVSVGRETSVSDIDIFIKDLVSAIKKLDPDLLEKVGGTQSRPLM